MDLYLQVSVARIVEKIVARHQLNHGGSVFMVQLENEHPHGWGTQVLDPSLKHLK